MHCPVLCNFHVFLFWNFQKIWWQMVLRNSNSRRELLLWPGTRMGCKLWKLFSSLTNIRLAAFVSWMRPWDSLEFLDVLKRKVPKKVLKKAKVLKWHKKLSVNFYKAKILAFNAVSAEYPTWNSFQMDFLVLFLCNLYGELQFCSLQQLAKTISLYFIIFYSFYPKFF